jgi:hypothetical protein
MTFKVLAASLGGAERLISATLVGDGVAYTMIVGVVGARQRRPSIDPGGTPGSDHRGPTKEVEPFQPRHSRKGSVGCMYHPCPH